MAKGSSSDITGLSADAFAELDRLFAAEGADGGVGRTIAPRDPGAPTPASFSQELLWMLDRASPGLTAYNLPTVRRLRGALDVPALERALTAVAARHEALRTRFADGDGHPVQLVDPPAPVAVQRIDLSAVPSAEREAAAEREVSARARTPIDLAHEPSFRITLLRLAADDHVLLIETHHIVVDGWSMGIVFADLATAYAMARAGREPELPPAPIQFGDVAAWERERLAGERLEELLSFWRTQIGAAANEPLALPTDFPRPTTPSFVGAQETVILSSAQLSAIKQLGQAQRATVYMTLLAAYATVLHRYTGRSDVLVGSGSAGRSRPETEGVVGYLNTTLVQRADFSGDPGFADLLGRVRDSAVDAYDHQDIPLEKLVLELRDGQERLSHAPLFEVVLTMQDTIGGTLSFEGITVERFGISFGATKFDVTLLVTERADGLVLTAQYRSELFAPATMRRLLGHVTQVLASAAERPDVPVSRILLLTADERAQLDAWNDTRADLGAPATIVELFEAQAARVGDRPAVIDGAGVALTYGLLNARANQLARRLRDAGVAPGAPVGLLLDRSADAIVGLLGILKAGGAYVPLSVDAPAARIAQQLGEAGAAIVVTAAQYAGLLAPATTVVALDRDAAALGALPETNPTPVATPETLAYVLYTSGSTGVPKGVAVTHANLVHYTRAVRAAFGAHGDEPSSGVARQYGLASTLAADLGNTSLFPALLSGATLHVLAKDVTTEPERFAAYLRAQQLDVLKITPNHLAALTAGRSGSELAAVLPRQWLVTGGEALRRDVARALVGVGACRVLNHYGPTETTVGVLTHEVTAATLAAAEIHGAQSVPLGRPLANTSVHVVDRNGQEQPVGIPGELWIGGAGVAIGYLHRPELTAERFVDFEGARVYRTGDRARRLADGTIEFLGRADDQVKVRGYRVELGEVEQALRAHPGVESAIALLRADGQDEPRLVAYALPRQAGYAVSHGDRATPEKLQAWVGAALPEYMVPSDVVLVEQWPLTPNGKIDRRALPAPDAAASAAADAYVAPRTETETRVAAIWSEVLKRERVGVTDDFLALGGHSLLAIRVLGRVSKAFGVRLSLRALFDAPTVELLARQIDTERRLAALEAMSDEDAERLLAGEAGPGTP